MNDAQCRCLPPCTQKFTMAEKDFIFSKYHGLGSHTEQTLYLRGCIVNTRDDNSAYSHDYYLKPSKISILVCQKYFLAILGIKVSRLRTKVTEFLLSYFYNQYLVHYRSLCRTRIITEFLKISKLFLGFQYSC